MEVGLEHVPGSFEQVESVVAGFFCCSLLMSTSKVAVAYDGVDATCLEAVAAHAPGDFVGESK